MRDYLQNQVASTGEIILEVALWPPCTHVYPHTNAPTYTPTCRTTPHLTESPRWGPGFPQLLHSTPSLALFLLETFNRSLSVILHVNFPWSLSRHPASSLCSYFSIYKILNCFLGTFCHMFIHQREVLFLLQLFMPHSVEFLVQRIYSYLMCLWSALWANDGKNTYSLGDKFIVVSLPLGEHYHLRHQDTYLVGKNTTK